MNNPTLDTAAIRKRFDKAVVGIREDGTMAVLLPSEAHSMFWNLCDGYSYELAEFTTLIRPGDECEVKDGEDGKWEQAIYAGYSGGDDLPFLFSIAGCIDETLFIRPLPAPAVEPEPTREQKAVEICRKLKDEVDKYLSTFGSPQQLVDQVRAIAIEADALFGEEGECGTART